MVSDLRELQIPMEGKRKAGKKTKAQQYRQALKKMIQTQRLQQPEEGGVGGGGGFWGGGMVGAGSEGQRGLHLGWNVSLCAVKSLLWEAPQAGAASGPHSTSAHTRDKVLSSPDDTWAF